MAKDKLTDYSATNASNTDVGGINIDEGMLPSAVNNSIRELMTHLKNFSDGTDAIDALTVTGDLTVDTDTLAVDATNNRVSINSSSSAKLTVASADSGVTPNTTGDEALFEGSGNTGITIGSGTSSNGAIYFGRSTNAAA